MRHTWIALCFLIAIGGSISHASSRPDDALWKELRNVPAEGRALPGSYRVFRWNGNALKDVLAKTPALVLLPIPDGTFERFRVEESPIMEAPLAARYPEIKTYRAQGIDNSRSAGRLAITSGGFYAFILSADNRSFVLEPYGAGDREATIVYWTQDSPAPAQPIQCLTDSREELETAAPVAPSFSTGATMHTYRVAIGATGEYTGKFGGTKSGALNSGIIPAVNALNVLLELEFAVHLNIIANETDIIYTDGATDPYTDGNSGAMADENQTNLTSVIGAANYDIGHAFGGSGGSGLAYLGVVCNNSFKARAASTFSNPSGTTWIIDLVAHEMGHQFDGDHSFNGTTGFCGGNRNAATAWEPGSGTTIMSYSGSCGAENVQGFSDPWYHVGSHDEIVNHISFNTCDVESATGNNPPTANAGPDYTIPQSTPFMLTASGSDPDADPLTYYWEEFNIGTASPPNTDDGSRPIFRSFQPTASPSRMFPQLSDILNNTTTLGESLPTTNRTLTFRVTARDNRTGGGGVADDSMVVTVNAASGPFLVTSPNTAITWNGGTTQTVTWNVAGTSGAPVSAANVNILLSTDGGNSFPITLLSSTPNDGTEDIGVPMVSTSTARVKVVAAGNIFFDISNVNFTITTGGCGLITVSPSSLSSGFLGTPYNATISASGGAVPYTFAVTTGALPPGLSLSSGGALTGTPTSNGSYDFTVTATDAGSCVGLRSYSITVTCPSITFSPPSLPSGIIGVPYSQTVTAGGAVAPVTFSILSGSLPNNLLLNTATGEISGTPGIVQTANFTLGAVDANGCSASRAYSLTINPVCLFCDDFEDGVVDLTWIYIKQGWSESGGSLIATPTGKKAVAVAMPVFAGCSSCSVEAAMQTSGGAGNTLWLLGWYVDKKNTIELLMKQESGKWLLKERIAGVVVGKAKGLAPINVNQSYDVLVAFDGVNFTVTIDGTPLITMPAHSLHTGTVGFQAKSTTGSFGFITVN